MPRAKSALRSWSAAASRAGAGARVAALGAVFAAGSAAALLVVGSIALPFRNPHDVIAPLVERGFAPGTNVVRFLVVVAAPIALLALVSLSRRARGVLLARAAPARVEPAVRGRAPVWVVPLLLAYAVLCGLAVHTYHAEGTFDPLHEGEALGLAMRLEDGGAPYADVAIAHGAIQDPLRALAAFRVLGRSIGAVRTLESLVKLAIFALIALVLLRLRPRQPGFAFVALGLLTLATLPEKRGLLVTPRELLPAGFLLLALVLAGALAADRRARAALAAGGMAALVPLTFVYSVDRGYFVAVLWVLFLGLALLQGARAARLVAPSCIGLAGGAGVAALLLGAGRAAFVDSVLVHSAELAGLFAGIEYDWSRVTYVAPVLALSALAFWTAVRLLERVVRLGPLAGLRQLVRDDPAALVLVLAALVFYRGALLRADAEHVRYSLWPALLCGLYLAHGALRSRVPAGSPAPRRLAVVATVAIAGFLAVRVVTQERVAANFPLGVPDERFLMAGQARLVRALGEELGADDVFANLTHEPGWYYLVDRPAPTRHVYVGTAVSAAQRRELRADLERAGVDVVLALAPGEGGIDLYPDRLRMPEVHAFVEAEFVPVRALGDYRILRRKGAGEGITRPGSSPTR